MGTNGDRPLNQARHNLNDTGLLRMYLSNSVACVKWLLVGLTPHFGHGIEINRRVFHCSHGPLVLYTPGRLAIPPRHGIGGP